MQVQQGEEAAAALKEAQDERDWARHDLGDAMASLQSLQVHLAQRHPLCTKVAVSHVASALGGERPSRWVSLHMPQLVAGA